MNTKNLIPFYFPRMGQVVRFNPLLFNEKYTAFKHHKDPDFRIFRILTLEEADLIQERLRKNK